jgi:hypothetical protein
MRAPAAIIAAVVASVGGVLSSSGAAADGASVLVVPGRRDVPVMYFGRDISWAIVEGERGLDRPGNEVTIVPARPSGGWEPARSGYFPSSGQVPRAGRLEIEPPADRTLPPPAESYHREWGVESAHTPVTIPAPYETPPILIGPLPAPPQHRPVPSARRSQPPGSRIP